MPYKVLFLIFFLFISKLNANDVDPYVIFQNYYQSVGGLKNLKAIKTSYIEGQIRFDNLTGSFTEWSKTPIQYRLTEDFSILTRHSGDNGQQSWDKDNNGKVIVYKDKESQQRRQLNILMNNYVHINRDDPNFSMSYEGQTSLNNKAAHIVKMTNLINDDIYWYYFDMQNFLLIKLVEIQPDIEIHNNFLDYKKVDGNIKIPFNTETEIKPRNKHKSIIVEKFQANPKVPDDFFKTPSESLSSIVFKQGSRAENIPFVFNGTLIYFPIQVQGKQSLWVIDSGASLSLIDEDYAKELGLSIHPGIKGFGFGATFDLSYVKIPSYGPQDVQVKNQTIYAYKGLAQRFESSQAKGILGYDFLSRFVVKINYAAKLISFYSPQNFKYTGTGTTITAPLKYNTFSIPVLLENKFHGFWSIDLGAYDASLHYSYAKKHGLLERKGTESISTGINSTFTERNVKFNSLKLGPYTLSPVSINIPISKKTGVGSFGELAGNLGNSILRYFILYLDYQNQQIILEPVDNSSVTSQ